jgi:hypothetical protein
VTPDELARLFHDTYERLAPTFGYRTREASAVPWEDVPVRPRALMTATAAEVLAALDLRKRAALVALQDAALDVPADDPKAYFRVLGLIADAIDKVP